tara:strand:- start:236 stop:856 length:621 start_codon:yes stop_codon:yes gene_type:complete
MNIERLLDSRRQVRVFDDINIPGKLLIRNLLNTTHRLVPSKQNLLPYKVHVLGPECKKEKLILYDLSKLNDPEDTHNTCSLAPYVLIFTNRLAKTNPAVQKRIDKKGHDYFMCDPKEYKKNVDGIEVGMFASTLTALCLEKEIDVSYMKCFPHWPGGQHYWKELPFVDETPFLTMSLGYRKHKQQPRHQGLVGEDKPEVNEVINWI